MTGVRVERGIVKYTKYGQTFYRVDIWLKDQNGKDHRVQRSGIVTLELARHVVTKLRADAYEGRFFERREVNSTTIKKLWEEYEPVSKRSNSPRTFERNKSLAAHVVEHLGSKKIGQVNLDDIEAYRKLREGERTVKGTPPSPATVNREVALLKRMLNYAVTRKKLRTNPLREVEMVHENNVRQVMIDEKDFEKILAHANTHLYPILVTAYDTGLRKDTILSLRWSEIDMVNKTIKVATVDSETKKRPPLLRMTDRVYEALEALAHSTSGYVFVNPKTNKPWVNIRKMWSRALKAAEIEGKWIHDLRRSFCTNARKRDVPESVVMKMSGHKTRAVFDRYNIVDDADISEAVRRIEEGRRIELSQVEGQ